MLGSELTVPASYCRWGVRDRPADAANTISTDAFARAVVFAISQPDDMDVTETLFRPTRQV